MTTKQSFPVMEEVTDAAELARGQAQDARFQKNWAWFEAHAPAIYAAHRGKCICVAGQELFVAETVQAAVEQAVAAHADDDGRFTRYIPRERVERVYAH